MLQYMTNIMYNRIRGQGWTYGVGISVSVNAGRLGVNFYRASDLVSAYKEFRKIIDDYASDVDDEKKWDPVKLDSARGTLIYSWVATEETPASLASSSVSTVLRQSDDSFYARRFVQRLSKVTIDQVKKAAKKYLHTFFYPGSTYSAVVCSPKEVPNVKEMLKEFKFDLVEIDDLEKSILTEP